MKFFDLSDTFAVQKSSNFATDMHISSLIISALCTFAMLAVPMRSGAETLQKHPFTVAIDARHGGKDFGCRGKKQNEKTITLDVARRLNKLIEKEYGDSVNVVMTRNSDVFISLYGRADIANQAEADLFISIHVNSVDKRTKGRTKLSGASVYTVGLHKSEANLSVAMRENSVIELEEDFTEKYQGFDPNSSESYIIFELGQNRNMARSIDFASMAQNELIATAGRADKGVRQAGFLVLWATKMPAVLVELDFICNPVCETFLGSDKGRQKCADALFNAFRQYYKSKN